MGYSGVSFVSSTNATVTVNFYTITAALNNATYTFNGTNLTAGATVVALGSSRAIHDIVATAKTGYAFSDPIWTSSTTSNTITAATSATTTFKAGADGTLTAKAEHAASTNKVTVTLTKNGVDCTDCNGYLLGASVSNTNYTIVTGATVTTTTSTTADITGAFMPGTTYYLWSAKDSNHKTAGTSNANMAYSEVSFTIPDGSDSTTATINYYTLTVQLSNTTVKVNGSPVAHNEIVDVLGTETSRKIHLKNKVP